MKSGTTRGGPSLPARRVSFLVVGTPRSGTTLVQRLACEIPGVVMPPETHFFNTVVDDIAKEHPFPLVDEASVRALLAAYVAVPANTGLDLDIDAVVRTLGGTCPSPMHLFHAVTSQLAGEGDVLGEKTPGHLRWWRPLSVADPQMRFIVVVREPRAVVSSNLAAPWSKMEWAEQWSDAKHLMYATQWMQDEERARQMSKALGPRVLTLRYEDTVAKPDATRRRIAAFLGRPLNNAVNEVPKSIVMPWESWKQSALGPIKGDRASGWKQDGYLTPEKADDVAAFCLLGMLRRRYWRLPPGLYSGVKRLRLFTTELRYMSQGEKKRQNRIESSVL